MTSEDEWYKAAYYKGGGTNAGYWDYPTEQRHGPGPGHGRRLRQQRQLLHGTMPTPSIPASTTTVVGEFQNSDSPYGTFDQGGNVWEWNEAIVYQDADYAYRGLRGGSFASDDYDLQASYRNYNGYPTSEGNIIGFRVSEVPEPSSIIALLGGLVGLLGMRRRR